MLKKVCGVLIGMIILAVFFASGVLAAGETDETIGIRYKGHVQNKGDVDWVYTPEELGTRGEGLRIEGFQIELVNAPVGAVIKYNVHVQNKGWLYDENDSSNWPQNGAYSGTKGEGLRIEAIKIVIEGLDGYDITYMGHVQNQGDLPEAGPWFRNGDQLGTTGSGLRLEALRVSLEKASAIKLISATVGTGVMLRDLEGAMDVDPAAEDIVLTFNTPITAETGVTKNVLLIDQEAKELVDLGNATPLLLTGGGTNILTLNLNESGGSGMTVLKAKTGYRLRITDLENADHEVIGADEVNILFTTK